MQPCRKVRRLTNDCLLLSSARADQITDYDQSGGNAHAGLQWSTGLQPAYRLDQLQPCPDCPLSVILVRLGYPKLHQHAVTHVLSHEPAESLHGLRNARLVRGNDLAKVLGVDAGRKCCRTDQSETSRDLTTLGGVGVFGSRG